MLLKCGVGEDSWESLGLPARSILKEVSPEYSLEGLMLKQKLQYFGYLLQRTAAAAAMSLQSCPTLRDPIDGSLPGSPVPGILQSRILEWVAISFSNAWKWKLKVKLLSPTISDPMDCSLPTRLLHPWDFPGKSTGVGCHCLLQMQRTESFEKILMLGKTEGRRRRGPLRTKWLDGITNSMDVEFE